MIACKSNSKATQWIKHLYVVVYVIWGRPTQNCFLAVTEINPDTYELEETHWLDYSKEDFGNAFTACGRLYFTATHDDDPVTYFALIWDLRTGNYTYGQSDPMTPW